MAPLVNLKAASLKCFKFNSIQQGHHLKGAGGPLLPKEKEKKEKERKKEKRKEKKERRELGITSNYYI